MHWSVRRRLLIACAPLFAVGFLPLFPVQGAAAGGRVYGCFRVSATEVNIRERAYSSSAVIGSASRGDLLLKWKRFCAWRGFWCPVQKGDIQGWADKGYLEKVPCPEGVMQEP